MVNELLKGSVFNLDMGFSRVEFKTLLYAQRTLEYDIQENDVTFQWQGQPVFVRLEEESIRRIGSFKIPKLSVHFDLSEVDEPKQQQFMKRFIKTFLKGGG